jgi:hypothetical protein
VNEVPDSENRDPNWALTTHSHRVRVCVSALTCTKFVVVAAIVSYSIEVRLPFRSAAWTRSEATGVAMV